MPQSIEGGVVIINTLSTKNNGNYPLVMAESVEMKNGKNVEDEITEITENISGIINDADINQSSTWSSENIVSRICPPFTTEGAIVTCQPVEGSRLNTVVKIEPIQEGEGEPSPENIRPITGWEKVTIWRGGKNLLGEDLPALDGYINGKDKTIVSDINQGKTYVIPIKKHGTFTASVNRTQIIRLATCAVKPYLGVNLSTVTTTTYTSRSITTNSSDRYLVVNLPSVDFETDEPMLVYGNESSYEPYCGKMIEIPFGQTVYGGTLDVGNGMLTVDRVLKTLSESENWLLDFDESKSIYWHSIVLEDLEIADASQFNKAVSSHYKYGINKENSFWLANSGNNLRIANNISTTEEWKDYLISENSSGHPVQVVYYIATPVTLQLTPQEILALSGVNTVYADAGDVAVSGYSDPNAIINSLADRIAALESATTSLIINELDYN